MREVLTPALWAYAWHTASMASMPPNAWRIALLHRRGVLWGRSFGAAKLLENDGCRRRAHALRIRFGKGRQRLACFGGLAAPGFGIAREPRRPRQIDGVDERRLFGIVRAKRSRGQRLRLGDLPIEVVGAQPDELERIEHEAFVKAGFQKRKAAARRIACRGRKPKRFLERGARHPVAADRLVEAGDRLRWASAFCTESPLKLSRPLCAARSRLRMSVVSTCSKPSASFASPSAAEPAALLTRAFTASAAARMVADLLSRDHLVRARRALPE